MVRKQIAVSFEVFEVHADGDTFTVGIFPNEREAEEFARVHHLARIGTQIECGCEVCEEWGTVGDDDAEGFTVEVGGWYR